jgi:hypothetical protein
VYVAERNLALCPRVRFCVLDVILKRIRQYRFIILLCVVVVFVNVFQVGGVFLLLCVKKSLARCMMMWICVLGRLR